MVWIGGLDSLRKSYGAARLKSELSPVVSCSILLLLLCALNYLSFLVSLRLFSMEFASPKDESRAY